MKMVHDMYSSTSLLLTNVGGIAGGEADGLLGVDGGVLSTHAPHGLGIRVGLASVPVLVLQIEDGIDEILSSTTKMFATFDVDDNFQASDSHVGGSWRLPPEEDDLAAAASRWERTVLTMSFSSFLRSSSVLQTASLCWSIEGTGRTFALVANRTDFFAFGRRWWG